nr:hypothetical protein [Rhodococcus sp. P1Y]
MCISQDVRYWTHLGQTHTSAHHVPKKIDEDIDCRTVPRLGDQFLRQEVVVDVDVVGRNIEDHDIAGAVDRVRSRLELAERLSF